MRNHLAVLLAAIAVVIIGFTASPQNASSHHTGVACGGPGGTTLCLPYADNSWAVNFIKSTGELTYCFNSRAYNYPNFRADVARVHAQQESAIGGFRWRFIDGVYATDAAARAVGCNVWNSMPDVHGCPGCGAWVHYLNSPVVVEYNWIHGYITFDTTIGHEEGHIFGLHEGYRDDVFQSHWGTLGKWYRTFNGSKPGTATDSPSVMDFGTGVWQWTAADVKFICQNIDRNAQRFTGCGFQEPPPCMPVEGTPCWTGEGWKFANGWGFIPNTSCGNWFDPFGRHAWGDCSAYGRFSPLIDKWVAHGSAFYDYRVNYHYLVP